MCWRSRTSSTASPSIATSKSGGPTMRSARMASVTVRRSPAVKPVHAPACARPCSNPTHSGLRNGRSASATMTIAVAMPRTRDVIAPRREDIRRRMVAATGWRPGGLLLVERPRLLPPGLEHEVGRWLPVELGRRPGEPLAEGVEVDLEQVAQPLDPGLDEQLVLRRAEAREVEEQCLVPPRRHVVRGRLDVVGEVRPPRRRLRDLEQDARREHALLLETGEMHGLDAAELGDGRHGRHRLRWTSWD